MNDTDYWMKYWRNAKCNDWNGIFYPAVQVPDDSCVPVNRYTGIVYYEREGSNKWLMWFNVVQNINVFLQVIKITCILSNHYNFFSILKTITLMLFETRWLGFHSWTQWMDAITNKTQELPYTGWKILPHKRPLLVIICFTSIK